MSSAIIPSSSHWHPIVIPSQIYGVLNELCQNHKQTHGLVIGGANRRAEADKLAKGVAVSAAGFEPPNP